MWRQSLLKSKISWNITVMTSLSQGTGSIKKLSCFYWICSVATCTNADSFPPAIQLLTALRFFAAGHFQVTDGDLLQCSQNSVSRFVSKISRMIAAKKALFIKFPVSQKQYFEAKQKFYEIAGFAVVIGAIDCIHIPSNLQEVMMLKFFATVKDFFQ